MWLNIIEQICMDPDWRSACHYTRIISAHQDLDGQNYGDKLTAWPPIINK
jgi:hypothetical protein